MSRDFATAILFFLMFPIIAFAQWDTSDIPPGVFCDADSDCFLLPAGPLAEPVPGLIYLSCTGGKPQDIDSVRAVHDQLGWAIATCGKSRNHRSEKLNEADILNLHTKLITTGVVDPSRIAIFGFSGQGAQAIGTALRHPKLFRGIITECAHTGGIDYFDPKASAEQLFFIITREKDWNRKHNETLHFALSENGISDTLIITPGEHGIGPTEEVIRGCSWINEHWK